MKVEELMFNDCVEWMGNYYKVDLPLLMSKYQYIKPIPLTAEILEKNGFEEDEEVFVELFVIVQSTYSLRLWKMPLYFEFIHRNFSTMNEMRINIKYVHELQHALRLCGLNELANNFKI